MGESLDHGSRAYVDSEWDSGAEHNIGMSDAEEGAHDQFSASRTVLQGDEGVICHGGERRSIRSADLERAL